MTLTANIKTSRDAIVKVGNITLKNHSENASKTYLYVTNTNGDHIVTVPTAELDDLIQAINELLADPQVAEASGLV